MLIPHNGIVFMNVPLSFLLNNNYPTYIGKQKQYIRRQNSKYKVFAFKRKLMRLDYMPCIFYKWDLINKTALLPYSSGRDRYMKKQWQTQCYNGDMLLLF